jgi:hypothetical protein
MGVTPEKVYPMLVSHQDMRVDPDGSWVTLKELFQNIEQLRDMQLISSIYRLIHALGKWEEYSKK